MSQQLQSRGVFCSMFVVYFWKQYEKILCQKNKTRRSCHFYENVDPYYCTPLDLKYFVDFFPYLFTFAKNICDIKLGAIIKTNFWGAPRWGHAMMVVSKPIYYDNGWVCFNAISAGGYGAVYHETWIPWQEDDDMSRCQPSHVSKFTREKFKVQHLEKNEKNRIYVMNPYEKLDMEAFMQALFPIVNNKNVSYSTKSAIRSAFRSCYKKSTGFEYIKEKMSRAIERHAIPTPQVGVTVFNIDQDTTTIMRKQLLRSQ